MGRRLALAAVLTLVATLAAALVWRTSGTALFAGPPLATLPGAPARPPALDRRLRAALAAKGPAYRPRTRHRDADGAPRFTNRLLLEASPYLLQHAHDPVDWYPWGDEAFARARAENKPVLLSIGYSTCHWCHVMEEESFEDEEIARFLNERYVAIKVDRERRPDVDAVYMAAVQAMTGGGGWPMTVWLTPNRLPFYGGTYFPPRDGDRGMRVGFLTVLRRIAAAFAEDPEAVAMQSEELARSLAAPEPAAGEFSEAALARVSDAAFARLRSTFDDESGGFGGAPKFPRTVALEFLLRYGRRTGNAEAGEMVARTLDAMARGGIRDHVGGGFHRYAVDAAWRVPHFEKTLYDNALLAVAYLEGYQATGRPELADVARDVLDWVAREMTAPEGAFWSATDADSEGEEGRFFVWTPAELVGVLGPERAARVAAWYGVTEEGNFDGRNVLHVAEPPEAVAARLGVPPAALAADVASARDALRRARATRVPPLRDEKVIVAWNGLMISAFARAAQTLGEPAYAARGARAADFVLRRLRTGGRLHRSWFEGRADGIGYLDDHAFLGQALVDLYEATFDLRWLREAVALHETLIARFADEAHGGFFLTPDDAEELLVREKPDYDGAEPSGNSVAVLTLLRLAELTTDDRWRAHAERAVAALVPALDAAPTAMPKLLAAVDFRLDTPKEIVIVRPSTAASAEPFLAKLRTTWLPNRIVAVAVEGEDLAAQRRLVPHFESRTALGGRPTAYVCEKRVCALPTNDPEAFAAQLERRGDGRTPASAVPPG